MEIRTHTVSLLTWTASCGTLARTHARVRTSLQSAWVAALDNP